MSGWRVEASFPGRRCVNVGMGGSIIQQTDSILQMQELTPSQTFIIVGTNNSRPMVIAGMADSTIMKYLQNEYVSLIKTLEELGGDYYFLSAHPVNEELSVGDVRRINTLHKQINIWLENEMQLHLKGHYINSWGIVSDESGKLRRDYSNDGLHFNAIAYRTLSDKIRTYMY